MTAAIFCAASVTGCAASGYTVFPSVEAFSEDIVFSAKILGSRAENAHDRMVDVIKEINADVSLTDGNSSLSKFNNAEADVNVEVGKHCYELFMLSQDYYELTDGAFNCAASPLSELWHTDAESISKYRPDIDGTHISPDLPTAAEVENVKSYCDISLVSATAADGKYYLKKSDPRVKLDFGGIAKGYAADKCAEILDDYSIQSALIDISGNAYFYGDRIDGGNRGDWHVGIASPRPRAGNTLSRGYVCAVSVEGNSSAVTSGDYMRYYIHDDKSGSVYVQHIMGRDGIPCGVEYIGGEWKNSQEYVISATVFGNSSALCDALSTAAVVLGLEDGARLLQKAGCKGLIFTEKRFTIIGDVSLYKPDEYDGYKAYSYADIGGAAQ